MTNGSDYYGRSFAERKREFPSSSPLSSSRDVSENSVATARLSNYWHLFARHTSVVEPMDPIHLVLKIMAHRGFRHLPVVNREREKETLGMVSAQDMIGFIASSWPAFLSSLGSEGRDLYSGLQNTVSTIMNDRHITITPKETILDSIKLMSERNTGALLIVENRGKEEEKETTTTTTKATSKEDKRSEVAEKPASIRGRNPSLVGIITLRDIVSLMASFAPLGVQVEDIMTRKPITIVDDDSVISAVELMSRNRVRRLPVINNSEYQKGRIEGMVTNKMIIRYIESVLAFSYPRLDMRVALERSVKTALLSPMPLIDPKEDCGTVAYLMRELGTGGFAVADSRGLVGVITERDLVKRTYENYGISFFSDVLFSKPQTIYS